MEIVMHEGKAYKAVRRHAREGDQFVVITGVESSYLTEGKVYEIKTFDWCDDPQIVDDGGDDYDLCESGCYAVLEPVDVHIEDSSITLLSVTPPIEKTYTLVVTDGFLERIEDALAHLGDVEAHALITQIREQ